MTTTDWAIGLSGRWATAANWDGGTPTVSTDVFIEADQAFGVFTITLAEAGGARSLTMSDEGATLSQRASGSLAIDGNFELDAGAAILDGVNDINGNMTLGTLGGPGATLTEGASGSLDIVGTLALNGGTAILRAANTIDGGVTLDEATVEVGASGALGDGAIAFQGDFNATTELLGLANVTLDNPLVVDGPATFAAAHGKMLTLANGDWSIKTNAELMFGDAADDGTVVWDSSAGASSGSNDIIVQGGTLKGGDANFGELFANAGSTTVDAGATLDLAGASINPFNLTGSGVVTSSAGAPTLTVILDSGSALAFAGSIRGSTSLTINYLGGDPVFYLTGTNTYSGATTVEGNAILSIGNGGTTGTLGSGAVNLDSGNLTFNRADGLTVANAITGTGGVEYLGGGTYSITGGGGYSGGTLLQDAVVCETDHGSAIGSGELEIDRGEFLATGDLTLVNSLFVLAGTFAAAHGKALTLALSSNWEIAAGAEVRIGDAAHDGTVVWNGGSGGTFDNSAATLEIANGALKDGDGTLESFVGQFAAVTIDAGATLMLKGQAGVQSGLTDLQGGGVIDNIGDRTTLIVDRGDFGGTIEGAVDLLIDGPTVLTGDSPGLLSIDVENSALALGDGGATGSAGGGPITLDDGALIIDHSNAFALTGAITSGNGVLEQLGAGVTTIDRTNAFDDFGRIVVAAGELSIDRASAIGGGHLDLQGGELLVTKSATLANASLSVEGNVTVAAATGATLSLDASAWAFDAKSITFGDAADAGTVVWHTPGGSGVASGDVYTVDIRAGALKAGDANLSELLLPAASTTIEADAALQLGKVGTAIGNLLGAGTISGTAGALLQIGAGDFSGRIKGDIEFRISGAFEESGANRSKGSYDLLSGSTLTLDHAAKQNVTFFGDATLAFTLGHAYTGTVSNFDMNVGQTMDFAGLSFATVTKSFSGGVLTIGDGVNTEQVKLAGTFVNKSFTLTDDGHGGVDVNFTGITSSPAAIPAASASHRFVAAAAGLGPRSGATIHTPDAWPTQRPMLMAPREAFPRASDD